MKILMLGWELPPHNSGGLGVACLNLARAISREGADIDFIIPYTAKHPRTQFMNVISATSLDPIYRYGGGAYDSLDPEAKIIPTGPSSDHISIRDVQHAYIDYVDTYLDDHTPTVIHAHDWLTYEAAIRAKRHTSAPFIAHVHATEYDRAGGRPGNPLIHEIEREGLLMADRIIAVSEATRRSIYEHYGIPLSKIEVIYNSLDEDFLTRPYHLDPDHYRYLEFKKAQRYSVVTTVGRFTIQKGLKFFLEAAALALKHNPRLIFVLAGDGELRSELISLTAHLGIERNVFFTGFIRGQKLRDIYAISDVFVMSSVSEPFGLTALEAAHHGNALILSHESGVSEIIWSAMKYHYYETRHLADEILAITMNPALSSTLSSDIRTEYDQISWDKVAKKCLKVYNNSVNHKRIIKIK